MRINLGICILLAGAGCLAGQVYAESVRGLDFRAAGYNGEQPVPSESMKHEYLSRGQDYLRQYLRDNLRRFVLDSGVQVDVDTMQTAATVNLSDLQPGKPLPLETKMRIWAAENVNDYMTCGRFVPLRLELESSYCVNPGMEMSARVKAPFDNLLQLELGSQMHWSEQIVSHWKYTLHNATQIYGGFNIGLGIQLADWRVALDYDMTPEWIQQQRITFDKNF
jgi:hypothetical protein